MEQLEPRQLLAATLTQYNSVSKTAYDASGNYYQTGLFSGAHNFGGTTLVARGDSDVYLAKYNSTGTLQWVQQFGGDYTKKTMREYEKREYVIDPSRLYAGVGDVGNQFPIQAGEYVTDLVVDSSGNAYITGGFLQSATINRVTLTSGDEDYYDGFLIKVGSTGSLLSAQQFGGRFNDMGMSLALDSSDSLYIGGYFSRTADLDPSRNTVLRTALGRDDGFVVKLTAAGKFVWSYQCGGEDSRQDVRDSVNDIAVTGNGVVYIAGNVSEKATFSVGNNSVQLKPGHKTDAFVAQLNRKGRLGWVQAVGGDSYDANNALTLGKDGSVYTAGYFSDTIDADPRANVTNDLEVRGNDKRFTDVLVSKYSADGVPQWQKSIGGDYYETVSDLTTATDGSLVLLGSFFNTIDVDPGAGVVNLSSTVTDDSIKDANEDFKRHETYDWYLLRFNSAGSYVGSTKFGAGDDDYASSITVSPSGKFAVSGLTVTATGDRENRHENATAVLFSLDLQTVTKVG